MKDKTIYHICSQSDWEAAKRAGFYTQFSHKSDDQFIHFSTKSQVMGSLELFFAGREDLVLLSVQTASLGEALLWERIPDGRIFPHLYSDLSLHNVDTAVVLPLDGEGRHVLPW